MNNVLFLVNVGRREAAPAEELLQQFEERMQGRLARYKIVPCDCKETAETHIQRGVEEGLDTIWIGGGDGTIHHVLNYTFGKKLTYGIVPMGTVNALARAIGLPEDPLEAVDYLLASTPTPMDVGEVNGNYFLCYASVGMHAMIFHEISPELKKKWGKLAFWESGFRTAWKKSQLPRFTIEFVPLELQERGAPSPELLRETGYSFLLSNITNYAGFNILLGEKAHGSGYLELHHFRRKKFKTFVKWFARMKLKGEKRSAPEEGMTLHRLDHAIVTAKMPLSVQADGEPLQLKDRMRLEFRCYKGAIPLLLRRAEAKSLLTPEPLPDNGQEKLPESA